MDTLSRMFMKDSLFFIFPYDLSFISHGHIVLDALDLVELRTAPHVTLHVTRLIFTPRFVIDDIIGAADLTADHAILTAHGTIVLLSALMAVLRISISSVDFCS